MATYPRTTLSTGATLQQQAVALSNGKTAVIWLEDAGGGTAGAIRAAVIAADGTVETAPFTVAAASANITGFDAIADGNGRFHLVYEAEVDLSTFAEIILKSFESDGTLIRTSSFGDRLYPYFEPWDVGEIAGPSIADYGSGFAVTYAQSNYDTLVQSLQTDILNASGVKIDEVSTGYYAPTYSIDLAAGGAGTFAVATLESGNRSAVPDLKLYDASGSLMAIGNFGLINSLVRTYPTVTALENGSYVYAFADVSLGDPRINIAIVATDGTQIGTAFDATDRNGLANAGGLNDHSVIGLPDGGFVVAWSALEADGSTTSLAQRFDANGNFVGHAFPVDGPQLSLGADGTFVAADGNADDGTIDLTVESELPVGTDSDDNWTGTALDDRFFGFGGDDELSGGAGTDRLSGGEGRDRLNGNDGDDFLAGGGGVDIVSGQAGNDVVSGQDGDDRLYGGFGNDTLNGGAGNDVIDGNPGADTLVGGDGDDILNGGSDDDTLNGGAGNDTLLGASGNDVAVGSSGDDFINGGAGDDRLDGNDGRDILYGSLGEDFLQGGSDADLVHGGEDNDSVNGNNGADRLYGAEGDDVLRGGDGGDFLQGGDGADKVNGGAQADTVRGGAGNDSVFGQGGEDALFGDDGNDFLFGGDQNDTLRGGAGDDVLVGGSGNDRFNFENGWGADRIVDFANNGIEKINLFGVAGASSLADLTLTDNATGVLIAFGGNSIQVNGLAAADLDDSDFIFASATASAPDYTMYTMMAQVSIERSMVFEYDGFL